MLLEVVACKGTAGFLFCGAVRCTSCFYETRQRDNPCDKTLLSPAHSSCKGVVHAAHISHTRVFHLCTAVHTFDRGSAADGCWQGLWRLRGKLITGNKQSNSIRGKLQMSTIQFVDVIWSYVGTNRGLGDTYTGGEFTNALAGGLWIIPRSVSWKTIPALKVPFKRSSTLCLR